PFRSLGAVEPQISKNLSDGARARQLAESGLEWAMSTQIGNNDFNLSTNLLAGTMTSGGQCGTGNSCRVRASSQAMPGLTSTQGTFAVTPRHDPNTTAGDHQLVGTTVTPDSNPTPNSTEP